MSLAAKGVVPPHAAFALVLGANLGTALNPVLEGAAGDDAAARRLPFGNLLNRALGAAWRCRALPLLGPWLVTIEPDNARARRRLPHRLQPGAGGCCSSRCWPVRRAAAPPVSRACRPAPIPPGRSICDSAAREVPAVALGAAVREALRLADVLEAMLQAPARRVQHRRPPADRRNETDGRRARQAEHRDQGLSDGLDPEAMTEADHRRVEEVLIFAHQPGTRRRRRGQEPAGPRLETTQARPVVLRRTTGRRDCA